MSKLNSVIAGAAILAVVLSGYGIYSAQSASSRLSSLNDQVSAVDKKVNPTREVAPAKADAVDIHHNPADLPAAITRTDNQTVTLTLETNEVDGKLADGTTYTYWTFNKTVPGPMLRVKEGDTVNIKLSNPKSSQNIHSIDLHAVNGPGGGAAVTQVKPGETLEFTFKALNPGVYVYHCASPHIPSHIAQGMFGMIVVEPKGGLAPVDKEFYVMQSEVYANATPGTKGHLGFDGTAMQNETPNFVVFNGAFQALTGNNAMHAKVGDKIRIFVGNGGPNLVSSFHIIGEIFDQVHPEGATEALHNVQTTVIPAGGATWVEFQLNEPGRYQLVDHSISRAIDKGAVAFIDVDGQPDPTVFSNPGAYPMPGMGGH